MSNNPPNCKRSHGAADARRTGTQTYSLYFKAPGNKADAVPCERLPVLRLIVAWIITRKTCRRNSAPLSTTPTKAATTASKASKIVLCGGKSSGLGLCSFTARTKSSTWNTCSGGSCSIHSRHIFHLLFWLLSYAHNIYINSVSVKSID